MQVDTIQFYDPPSVLRSVGYLSSSLSQSALVMLTNDHEGQATYVKEVLGVATILFSIWLVWSCLLLICRGANCVSADMCCSHPTSKSSTSTSRSNDESLNGELEAESGDSLKATDDDDSRGASCDSNPNANMDNVQPTSGCHSFAKTIGKHWHFILRFLFLLASTALLSSSVLVLDKASFPVISVLETTDHLIEEAQHIVATTHRAIRVIQDTSSASAKIEGQLRLDLIDLCPDLPHFYLVHELGVDPYDFVLFLDRGHREFSAFSESSADRALEATAKAELQLQSVRDAIQVGQDWIWILSLLMLCMTIFTLVFLFSVFWAIIQEQFDKWYYALQQKQWENMMAWAIVPLFAILSAVVWAAAIFLSTGTIIVTDVCLPTPDESILFVLRNMDDTLMTPRVLDTVSAFMTGCHDDDPLDMLHTVEGSLNGVLSMVDNHLQDVFSNGYGPLDTACGANNKLDRFFASASQLSYYLRHAHDVVLETLDVLDCAHVSGLYHSLFHDALCSEFASAVSYGYIFVFSVAIASLQILTFRGAWNYVQPAEDFILH